MLTHGGIQRISGGKKNVGGCGGPDYGDWTRDRNELIN